MIKIIIQSCRHFFGYSFLSLSIDYKKNAKCYEYGNRNARSKVGDYFIKEKMQEGVFNFIDILYITSI